PSVEREPREPALRRPPGQSQVMSCESSVIRHQIPAGPRGVRSRPAGNRRKRDLMPDDSRPRTDPLGTPFPPLSLFFLDTEIHWLPQRQAVAAESYLHECRGVRALCGGGGA